MSKSFVVVLENKSFTWEGGRWYGTIDFLKPTLGQIHRLNALLAAVPVKKSRRAVGEVVDSGLPATN